MKANFSFDFTELDRRTVRASVGRGGQSTRKELRIFVERAIRAALHNAPEPKPKRQKKAVVVVDQKREAINALPDDVRCKHCGRIKEDHGRMSMSCLPKYGVPKGKRFEIEGAL